MGTGSSKTPNVGVPINPRVNYAEIRSKAEGKAQLIDAPVLVKVENGTLRYRYKEEQNAPPNKMKERIELAHEGPERSKKHGYFFHSTLNDFSEDANYSKEEDWKFCYVYKGPNSTKQKKVYYVYGKGLGTAPHKGGIIHEPVTKPEGKGFSWPTLYKVNGHVYYDLNFPSQDQDGIDDEDVDMTEHVSEDQIIELNLKARDRMKRLTKRLAVRLVKPAISIHVFHQGIELRPDVMLSELKQTPDNWTRYQIRLTPK